MKLIEEIFNGARQWVVAEGIMNLSNNNFWNYVLWLKNDSMSEKIIYMKNKPPRQL